MRRASAAMGICTALGILTVCQIGGPTPTPSPSPSIPVGKYIDLEAETLGFPCQGDCFSHLVTARLGQTVRLRMTIRPSSLFTFFSKQLYVGVQLPVSSSSNQQPTISVTAALTTSAATSSGSNSSSSLACTSPLGQLQVGSPVSCDKTLIVATAPALLSYQRGTTTFTTNTEPLTLDDQSGTSVLLLKQGFSLYQTRAVLQPSIFYMDVTLVPPPAQATPSS